MLKWILLSLLSLNTFALELSIDSAKDEFSKYSVLHLIHSQKFVCQEVHNDFDVVTEIICSFSKRTIQDIKDLQNDFFRVDTFIKNNTFFVRIKPLHKIHLIPDIFDLCVDDTVFNADISRTKRWTILGYTDKLPLINNRKKPDNSIDFPFFISRDKLPYVGSLDLKGNPVHIKEVVDVNDYLKVKKYYNEKKYIQCMDLLTDILESYPHTLFKAELIHYKINLYNKLKDYDNVISFSKIFLREYSADENIPEILSLIAKAYTQIGMNSDADYFFDRLFSEHKKSVFTTWGYIYKGEMLEASGGFSKAMNFYKKALYTTTSIDVAVDAAFHLALANEDKSKKITKKYVDKILQSKPSFFKQEYKKSKDMMYNFAEASKYTTAAAIDLALLNEMDATYDDYEEFLKDRALWLSKTKDKQEALKALNKYMKQFPDGDFLYPVEIAKDALFFDTSDANTSVRLLEYDKLIQTYANDTIGNRALYEKAKLLLKEAMYGDVLEMRESLMHLDTQKYDDVEQIIKKSAIGVMKNSLKDKECKDVLLISDEYNITLSNKWDDGIYSCAMKGGNFQLSKSIALKNLKNKDLDQREKWLFRYIKVDFSTGNYSDVLEASHDLVILMKEDKKPKYNEVYRYIFDTYERLEDKDKLLSAMMKIEEVFGVSYKDIERYISIMTLGSDKKDDNIVIQYGKKVLSIQKSSSSHAQSPYVEFTLYQAYMNKENYNSALNVMSLLDTIELDNKNRARQKYLKGVVLNKLWRDDKAKNAYSEAIKADPKSPWAKLAKSAQEI